MELCLPSGTYLLRHIYSLCNYHLDQIRNPWGKGTLKIREKTR